MGVHCFIFTYYLFYVWLSWVFTAAQGLSLVAESRGHFLAVVHRLLVVVASRCRAQVLAQEHQELQLRGSLVVACRR